MLMTALAFVSSTSVAAALCSHQDAQQHELALGSGDQQLAAAAELEEAAGAVAARKGTLADAGAFGLAAFILPASSLPLDRLSGRQAPVLGENSAKIAGLAPQPLLEPPAA
jgi:hypothetical protein